MGKALALTGQRFGRLKVIKRVENSKAGQSKWLCKCDCGNIIEVNGSHLKLGHSKSCGCLQADTIKKLRTKHGHTKNYRSTKTYSSWASMIKRCNNPNNPDYKYYGGRGIKVCDRWLTSFTNFFEDMGERPKGLTLDRKNNNGDYTPDNCRWVTQKQQIRNSRSSKLNPLEVQVIKKLLKESSLKQGEIAEIFKVTRTAINSIRTEENWADICYEKSNLL